MLRGADRSRFGTVDLGCDAHGKVPPRRKESEATNGNPAAVKPARHASDYRRSLWRSRLKPRAILVRFDVWPEAAAGPTESNAAVQSRDGINTQGVIAIAMPCRGLLATQFLRPACPSPLMTSSIRRRLPCASVRPSTENRRWVSPCRRYLPSCREAQYRLRVTRFSRAVSGCVATCLGLEPYVFTSFQIGFLANQHRPAALRGCRFLRFGAYRSCENRVSESQLVSGRNSATNLAVDRSPERDAKTTSRTIDDEVGD